MCSNFAAYNYISTGMFKQLTAFLLLTAFMVQTFRGIVVIADYYTNTGAFAKNCVNKARPKMHCNGKCQMMKKLREEEKQEQKKQENRYENKTEVLSSKSFFLAIVAFPAEIITEHIITSDRTIVQMSHSLFHPPSA